ncbi:MAG: hypothetical protein DYG88_15520 [Chloroflexi bacterium CFX4]|nr:hypothetical protein [Chloroflexi bacterium CFX4]MDL1924176.1 hypothetical protein [Chloroflexi bacterium CFX3]
MDIFLKAFRVGGETWNGAPNPIYIHLLRRFQLDKWLVWLPRWGWFCLFGLPLIAALLHLMSAPYTSPQRRLVLDVLHILSAVMLPLGTAVYLFAPLRQARHRADSPDMEMLRLTPLPIQAYHRAYDAVARLQAWQVMVLEVGLRVAVCLFMWLQGLEETHACTDGNTFWLCAASSTLPAFGVFCMEPFVRMLALIGIGNFAAARRAVWRWLIVGVVAFLAFGVLILPLSDTGIYVSAAPLGILARLEIWFMRLPEWVQWEIHKDSYRFTVVMYIVFQYGLWALFVLPVALVTGIGRWWRARRERQTRPLLKRLPFRWLLAEASAIDGKPNPIFEHFQREGNFSLTLVRLRALSLIGLVVAPILITVAATPFLLSPPAQDFLRSGIYSVMGVGILVATAFGTLAYAALPLFTRITRSEQYEMLRLTLLPEWAFTQATYGMVRLRAWLFALLEIGLRVTTLLLLIVGMAHSFTSGGGGLVNGSLSLLLFLPYVITMGLCFITEVWWRMKAAAALGVWAATQSGMRQVGLVVIGLGCLAAVLPAVFMFLVSLSYPARAAIVPIAALLETFVTQYAMYTYWLGGGSGSDLLALPLGLAALWMIITFTIYGSLARFALNQAAHQKGSSDV